jgi:predicted DNA-binding antitoxin AbrB/MazE fold protein
MTPLRVEATYEDGVLKPAQPLPLKEHEHVRVTVETGRSPLLEAYGIMGFKGTAEEAEYFALHADLLPEESR